jgi:hypothetical protein
MMTVIIMHDDRASPIHNAMSKISGILDTDVYSGQQ